MAPRSRVGQPARATHVIGSPPQPSSSSEVHFELRRRQAGRVFGEGVAPSDEGLIESEPILGALA
jgi:hypothetical protein